MTKLVATLFLAAVLSGCMSISDINQKIQPANAHWQREYEANKYEQRYRFSTANLGTLKPALLETYKQLGMPIFDSTNPNVIISRTVAPAPLTVEEWSEVVKVDDAKAKELSQGVLGLGQIPSDYTVTSQMLLKQYPAGTLLVMEYETQSLKYEGLGVVMPKIPSPHASKLATDKFWSALNKTLINKGEQPVRMVAKEDLQ